MSLGTCLVVGGCGFLGFHLVGKLLEDEACQDVCVLDLDTRVNRQENVTYISGDIADSKVTHELLAKVKPTVIFHMASPPASLPVKRQREYLETNVNATNVLLPAATALTSVKAFVYTSSVDVYSGVGHENFDESCPLWPETDYSNVYNRTKAIGDRLASAANCDSLRTACLRLGHAYGEKQSRGLVEIINMCEGNKSLFQIGNGKNLMEVVSAENIAVAHVLAAKALTKEFTAGGIESGSVGGEAFNISDGSPVPFWHHVRVIWKEVRGEAALGSIITIPAWVMVSVVLMVEWVLWLTTLNMVKPPTELRRTSLEYCIYSHTYQINYSLGDKALLKSSYSNFTFEAEITLPGDSGNAGLIFRVSNPSDGADAYKGYYAGISTENNVVLGRASNDWTQISLVDIDIAANKAHHLKVKVRENKIDVYVNDMTKALISATDSTYTSGMDGVRLYDTGATFDNVQIFPLAFKDDFASGSMDKWIHYGGDYATKNAALVGQASTGGKALIRNTLYSDFVYEADVTIWDESGDAGLVFRASSPYDGTDGYYGYYAGFGNGYIVLGRSDNGWNELANISASIQHGTAHHIMVRARQSSLSIFVDDMNEPKIETGDDTYLTGLNGVRVYGTKTTFDNVVIYTM